MSATKIPVLAICSLGVTQIVGYGTLFYSYGILAPSIAAEFGVSREWVFAMLAGALFLGSLAAPAAGRLADRHGAARLLTLGSLAAGLALAGVALAPNLAAFAVALALAELAASLVLYSTAFVALVQIAPAAAGRSITHLTLIAGFASTVFWPLTTLLHDGLSWREVYLVYAGLNLLICMPLHAALMRLARRRAVPQAEDGAAATDADQRLPPDLSRRAFPLMLAGFALAGFVISAILVHMVPLLEALGLGDAGVLVSTLFGPAQVASRLINMLFGRNLPQAALAVIAAALPAAALLVLIGTAPAVAGVAVFVILFGLGSGLTSIIGGTLPLELFGRAGYGARVGWASAARQFSSAFAPFAFAFAMVQVSIAGALWMVAAAAAGGTVVFALTTRLTRLAARRRAGR